MKRILLAVFAAVPIWAAADDGALAAVMRTNKLSSLEAAAVVVVADVLGLDADFVISTGRRTGASPSVYSPALILSERCHKPFSEVWKARGKGWGQVAHSIGMHPGTFNKLRKQGHSVEQIIWIDALHKRYGVSHGLYDSWRKRGLSHGRVLEMIAKHEGRLDSIGVGRPLTHPGKGKGPGHSGGPPAGKGMGRGNGKGNEPAQR